MFLGGSSIVAGVRVMVVECGCRRRRRRRSPLEVSRRQSRSGVLLRRGWNCASVGGVVVRVTVSQRRRVPWMTSCSIVVIRSTGDSKVGIRTPAVRPPNPSSLDHLLPQRAVASLSSPNGCFVRRHPRDTQPLRLVTPSLHRLSCSTVVSPSTRRWKLIRRSRLPTEARHGVLRVSPCVRSLLLFDGGEGVRTERGLARRRRVVKCRAGGRQGRDWRVGAGGTERDLRGLGSCWCESRRRHQRGIGQWIWGEELQQETVSRLGPDVRAIRLRGTYNVVKSSGWWFQRARRWGVDQRGQRGSRAGQAVVLDERDPFQDGGSLALRKWTALMRVQGE